MEKAFKCDKWLRRLACIAMVSLVNSAVDYIPFVPADITIWIGRAAALAVIFCMFHLAAANARYKKAGAFRAAVLACTLISAFPFGLHSVTAAIFRHGSAFLTTALQVISLLLTLATFLLSILASYHEYCAHSEMVAAENPNLSRNWRKLFYWGIAAALLVSFGTTITSVILTASGHTGNIAAVFSLVHFLLSIPGLVIGVIYLLYLRETAFSCRSSE